MGTQLRNNFADFFGSTKLPELQAIIMARTESYPSMIPILFNQEQMSTDIYQTTTHSGLRNPSAKAEGQAVTFQTMSPGYDKTYTSTTYATGYRISKEAVDDGKFSLIQKATESFAKGMFEIRETNAADVFNDAFTTNGPDGVPLCSASHPLENGAGDLGVNKPATASELSVTSYRELRNIMQNTVNENGQLVKYMHKYLVVPQALQDTAIEIIKSTHNPENANNAVNTIYENVQLIPGGYWNYLTSDTAFFLVSEKMDHSLMFLEREPMSVDSDYDKHAFAHELIASCRFTQGFSGWRGVAGNAGA